LLLKGRVDGIAPRAIGRRRTGWQRLVSKSAEKKMVASKAGVE